MIAYLIGGPEHGKEHTVGTQHPSRTLKTLEAPEPRICFRTDPAPLPCADFVEHEYQLLYHDGRYAIYRWLPPRVMASFEFTVRSGHDTDILERKVYDLIHGDKLEGQAIKVTQVDWDWRDYRLAGHVIVDGPPDAKAAEDAAAAVKNLIDRELRFFQITQCTVSVDG